jgi:sRNA-binding regulator protein Hfq
MTHMRKPQEALRAPKNARAPRKPRWSHQHELNKAAADKRMVWIDLGDVRLEVKLLEADQFTVKVENDDGTTSTIFKHAIVGYTFPAE